MVELCFAAEASAKLAVLSRYSCGEGESDLSTRPLWRFAAPASTSQQRPESASFVPAIVDGTSRFRSGYDIPYCASLAHNNHHCATSITKLPDAQKLS